MSQVNITTTTNKVEVNTTNNQIVVTNPVNPNTVSITQPVTTVVDVITAGPQGPQGPAGVIPNTSSFATTGSNTFIGNQTITGSLLVTGSTVLSGGITGSLLGTASYATQALSASYSNNSTSASYSLSSSYAQTASYVQNAQSASYTLSSSYAGNSTSASYSISSSIAVSSSYALTASYVQNAQSASYVLQAVSSSFASTASLALQVSTSISTQNLQHNVLFVDTTGPGYIQVDGGLRYNPNQDLLTTTSSYALLANTASYVQTAQSASYVLQAVSSSFASTSSYATSVGTLNQNVSITGNLDVIGTASFTYVTESIVNVGAATINLNTNYPATRFGGINVVDSGSFGNSSTGSLFWDSLNNRWIYANPSGSTYDGGMLISGPRNTSGIGNEVGMDVNFVAIGQGEDHIRPGTIYNSGSGATAITQITGSLTVSGSTTTQLLIGTNTLFVSSSGNVGIGTTNPDSYYSKKLVIATPDENGLTLAATTTSATNYLAFADGVTGNEAYRGYVAYKHVSDQLAFGSAGTLRMTINSSGNVGIGTSTPNAKLDVNGNTIITGSLLVSGSTTLSGSLFVNTVVSSSIQPANNPSASLMVIGGTTIQSASILNSSAVLINPIMSASANSQTLSTFEINSTFNTGSFTSTTNTALRVGGGISTFSGNVGIGTTSVSSPLTVQAAASNGTPILKFTDNTVNFGLFIGTGGNAQFGTVTNHPLYINTNNAVAATILGNGNFGINTSSNTARLAVLDTTLASGSANAGSLMDLQQTWNTTGVPTSIKLNVTDTQSNTNSLLMDLQVAGVSKFYIKKSGEVVSPNIIYAKQYTLLSGVSTLSADFDSGTATIYNTSGIFNVFGIAKTFSPTSGTATFTGLNFATTINQTGGANGITRGIYINPTLTSAADFRAIESTSGSIVLPYTPASATYSIKTSDYLVNFTTGTFTATLPTAVGCVGKTYVLKNSGAGIIAIATTSSQTIDGTTPPTLIANKYIQIVSTGANWIITGNN